MEDVQAILERPTLYENVDGSSELMLGSMMIGFTVYEWVGSHARQDSIWNNVFTLLIFATLLVTAILYARKAMKSLITYRRTGFISYRKPSLWWPGLIGLLAASTACGLALLTSRRVENDPTALVTIVLGLFMAAAYAYRVARVARWKWIVAAVLVINAFVIAMFPVQLASAPMSQSGLAIALNVRLLGSLFWFNAFTGVILLISGVVSLALYLHDSRGVKSE
ncbi:MAG: hypothetical protein WA354_14855 [Terracidiphilus sp.]